MPSYSLTRKTRHSTTTTTTTVAHTTTTTTTVAPSTTTTTTTIPYTADKTLNIAFYSGTPAVSSSSWNSWPILTTAMNINSLNWSDGSGSGIRMYMDFSQGAVDNGSGWGSGNSLGAPAGALRYSTIYSGGRRLSLSGLDPNRKYTIELIDSRSSGSTVGTSYYIFGRNIICVGTNNISNSALFPAVKPTYKGQIDIYMERSTSSGFGAITAIRITETNDTTERSYAGELSHAARYCTTNGEVANALIGDFLITGPTDTTANSISLYPGNGLNPMLESKYGTKKILIKGGNYESISIQAPGCDGTPSHPILITNYGGRIKTKSLVIAGMRYFKLTGEYDVASKTGDSSYVGHRDGFAFTAGKYGIEVNSQFSTINGALCSITGFDLRCPDSNDGIGTSNISYPPSDFTLRYVELCNGGFANMFKWDDHSVVINNPTLDEIYVHDTHGEGAYVGPTHDGTLGPNRIMGLWVKKCRFLRCGNEAFQFSQNAGNAIIENNVFHGGVNWKSPFGVDQDGTVNLSPRGGGNTIFRNNICLGGSASFHIFLYDPSSVGLDLIGLTSPMQTIGDVTVTNNLLLYPRSHISAFIDQRDPCSWLQHLNITNNFFGMPKYRYNEVWLASNYVKTTKVLRVNRLTIPTTITGNVWDGIDGKTTFLDNQNPVSPSPVTATGNTLNTVPSPLFSNYMGGVDSTNLASLETWNQPIGYTFRQGTTISSISTTKYLGGLFSLNQYVLWKGVLYKCKQAHQETSFTSIVRDSTGSVTSYVSQPAIAEPRNTRGENTGDWTHYWAEVWFDSTGAQFLDPIDTTGLTTTPPDDVHITNSFYSLKGIGL